eukprot:3316321-Pyramimonas_sp.AAC.1
MATSRPVWGSNALRRTVQHVWTTVHDGPTMVQDGRGIVKNGHRGPTPPKYPLRRAVGTHSHCTSCSSECSSHDSSSL